ncbi:MAG: IS1182 family transposase [Actinobacteria bacterium]|nr:IS1182 family transposase [Actinomycetota bacterium]
MMRRRSEMPAVPPQPWSELIPADSFYARLARWRDVLVNDEDYAPLYKDSPRGRPSIPPSMVVLAMLLEYHDDCSDAEAEQRMRFDLRWKHALGIGLQDEGFDATVLCRFRRKLLDHGLERALFERLVRAAREADLLTKDAAQLLDSSHVLGAAGARDTYALIRGGIRKLLRSLGYTSARRSALGEQLGWYIDPDSPEKPQRIDWSDAEARAEHLKEVVADARAVLSLAEGASSTTPAANEAAALLQKIVSDDVEEGEPPPSGPKRRGRPPKKKERASEEQKTPRPAASSTEEREAPRLRRGVARDRILSVVDPQMRVGHKSQRQSWAGYKVHITEEPESELITAVEVRPANEYDAEAALSMVERQEESVGLLPGELLCDGAYGSADVRAELRKLGVEVVAKMRPLTDGKHFRKDEFEIDLSDNGGEGSVTCPAGVRTTDFRMARDGWYRPVKLFRFPKEVCERCELKERCLGGPAGRAKRPVRIPPGRQVQLHYHEEVIQEARAEEKTAEQKRALRERLRLRAKVERKISEALRLHGLRQGRYFGREKTELQAQMTAAMVNAKRLFTLSTDDEGLAEGLREALLAA